MPSPGATGDTTLRPPTAANRLGLDYRAEARAFAPFEPGLIDVHTHVNGQRAAGIWAEAADLYGVRMTYTQTQRNEAKAVARELGDKARFIAIPDYMSADRGHAFREGFLENMRWFHGELGARIVKFWWAPRFRDYMNAETDADLMTYDNPWRLKAIDLARELGMMFMTHVGDPDTWFQTTYADASRYGTKSQQYEGLERLLAQTRDIPWIAAHMGGWPENLPFLTAMLDKHPNLHLDTSATKWQVRELSRHPGAELRAFFRKYQERIFFGSDIVTHDDHLIANDEASARFGAQLASNAGEAFDLYASRYWALRTLFETEYEAESPIADPDLMMVEPETHDAMSAPKLVGKAMARDDLDALYRGAVTDVVTRWEAEHGIPAPAWLD